MLTSVDHEVVYTTYRKNVMLLLTGCPLDGNENIIVYVLPKYRLADDVLTDDVIKLLSLEGFLGGGAQHS